MCVCVCDIFDKLVNGYINRLLIVNNYLNPY